MPRRVDVPEWMEENPDRSHIFDWGVDPDELVAALEADVAALRRGGDAA
jgi:hypothetical protein